MKHENERERATLEIGLGWIIAFLLALTVLVALAVRAPASTDLTKQPSHYRVLHVQRNVWDVPFDVNQFSNGIGGSGAGYTWGIVQEDGTIKWQRDDKLCLPILVGKVMKQICVPRWESVPVPKELQ